jgi:hypothetical protein
MHVSVVWGDAREGRGALQRAESAMPECRELSLEEMLLDPIVRAVMAADGVDPDDVRALTRAVAKRRMREDEKTKRRAR